MTRSGRLIVIEGPDHVGRSLHVRLLVERLEAHGVAVATTGLARSELMGGHIKTNANELHQLNWRTRSLMYATDMHDQQIHLIEPLLEAGFVVIADRYTLTPVIREQIRGGDPVWIEGLYRGMPQPNLTVVLQAGGRRLLNRMMHNNTLVELNNYEAGLDMGLSPSVTTSFLEYQKLLREAFRSAAEARGLPVVHTRQTVEQVHKEIWSNVEPVVEHMLQQL